MEYGILDPPADTGVGYDGIGHVYDMVWLWDSFGNDSRGDDYDKFKIFWYFRCNSYLIYWYMAAIGVVEDDYKRIIGQESDIH